MTELSVRLAQVLGDETTPSALPFVPPRPEGRGDLVSRLLTRIRHTRRHHKGELCVIQGEHGMGRTTVLMELKWRLQVGNVPVLHVRGDMGSERSREALAQHAARLSGHTQDASAGLADVLARGTQRGGWVVIADDIDQADPALREALLEALHCSNESGLQVVVSTGPELPKGLTPDLRFELPPLDRSSVDSLVGRALGSLDRKVCQALWERSAGNPGVLIEMLASLHGRHGIAAADVAEMPVGRVGEHRARAQMARMSEGSRRAVLALALAGGALPEEGLRRWLGADADPALDGLSLASLVQPQDDELRLVDRQLGGWLRERAKELSGDAAARALLGCGVAYRAPVEARLSLAAGERERFMAVARPAAEVCVQEGDLRGAIWLYARLLDLQGDDPGVHLSLVKLFERLGEHGPALTHARLALEDAGASVAERAGAVLGAAHALQLSGRPEEAVRMLGDMPSGAPVGSRIDAHRQRARIYLHAYDHAAARREASEGLGLEGHSTARSELLAIDGLLNALDGDEEGARARYEAAAEQAREDDDHRAELKVMGYAAFGAERTGQLDQARAAYRRCLAAAQAAGDLGATATNALNLGNVSFRLGDIAAAQENYALAHRMARRAGQGATEVYASNNAAHLHLYLGLYAQAGSEASASLRVAENLDLSFAAAQAHGILADIACRSGSFEAGVVEYEQSARELESLGRLRELAEIRMDYASAILDAGRRELGEQVAGLLDGAAVIVDEEGIDDFRPRLSWLRARYDLREGRQSAALSVLDELENQARDAGDRELLWCVLATAAEAHQQAGRSDLSGRRWKAAGQVIDAMADALPAESREAFRGDPRRRRVLERAQGEPSSHGVGSSSGGLGSSQTTVFGDGKHARLFELIKRLAREHDVERLLERITDAAVELSGAERGFVLLTNEQGQLESRVHRERRTRADQRHADFSMSIAEAVLIDGEPIVTIDAQGDARVNEFMSVHRLSLRSVACLPICGAERTVGVLYLEHRLRAGRFREQDVDLLFAFADQAAIAIENARLWSALNARQQELQEANQQLETAKRDVERVLAARTDELGQVQQDLGKARAVLARSTQRFGMVGRSARMGEVFAVIERVQHSNVPVVIQGESGTGKELVARAIHEGSTRSKGSFVALNCGAVPEALLESELFGHVRGAFTGADRDRKGLFAEASGGTLFLDEFADIPMRMQVDLLRVLQEGSVRPVGGGTERAVDVRVLVACNRDVERLVSEGRVRQDLFYRLSVVQIHLPPLRERSDDIPLLCDHLLARISAQHGGPERRLSKAALRALASAHLPGNVRQLEHLLMSASLMTDAAVIEVDDLPLDGPVAPRGVRTSSHPPPAEATTDAGGAAPDSMPPPADLDAYRNHEREGILRALQDCGWNRARAAETMGMPRRTFYRRLKQYGIQ